MILIKLVTYYVIISNIKLYCQRSHLGAINSLRIKERKKKRFQVVVRITIIASVDKREQLG